MPALEQNPCRKRCYSFGMSDSENASSKKIRHEDAKRPRSRERDRSRERNRSSNRDRGCDRDSREPDRDRKRDDLNRSRDKDRRRDKEAERGNEKDNKPKEKKFYTPRQSNEEGHFHVVCGENITERFKILDLMGQGTFAKVVEAWDRKEQVRCAIKIVRATKKYTRDAQFEIDILERVKRKDPDDKTCLVKVVSSFLYTDPRTDKEHMCIIFPKLGPSLLDFITRCATFTLPGIAQIAKQIFEALDFLHTEMNLIHTDLKPENILVCESGYTHEGRRRVPRSYRVRIIDFGGATDEGHSGSSIVSTRHYRAPEVILGSGWMYPADMWSVGSILIELYTGDVLFSTHENREHLALMEAILGPFPEGFARKISDGAKKYFKGEQLRWPEMASSDKSISKVSRAKSLKTFCDDADFIDLVQRLLDYDKKRRLTARDALTHNFIVKHIGHPSMQSSLQQPQTGPRRQKEEDRPKQPEGTEEEKQKLLPAAAVAATTPTTPSTTTAGDAAAAGSAATAAAGDDAK
eukprot:NODE_497_length_2173_cov_38.969868_g457_i0.p1 GENE.NODE_497_length_2173_cov_38.969868_g457_i0~~NODE_497_length_2173_cov_38.969868_g457_i0.p1  ORF type:complete len:538 (-),score=114.00 NODE_497_length_2173_cov_38.969868_g457_i0:560-2122(-)